MKALDSKAPDRAAAPRARAENLGQHLIARRLLTPPQLELAMREHKRLGDSLGRTLCRLRFMSEDSLADAIADILGLERVSLKDFPPNPSLFAEIPKEFAVKHSFVPLRARGQILEIAMADPSDVVSTDIIQQRTGRILKIQVAPAGEIHEAISRCAGPKDSLQSLIESTIDRALEEGDRGARRERGAPESEIGSAIIQLADGIIQEGISEGATDIHIEPEENLLRVRYRIDGILHQGCVCPKPLQAPLLSRIKVLANLDISERRLPQDGRFQVAFETNQVDIRVSVMPTAHGENVVLRILDKKGGLLDLPSLGFPEDIRKKFTHLLSFPYGILLVTGPTGSGKSTTLYGALNLINSMEKKVVTVEDPIEYQIPLVRQSQVNPQVGFTFAAGLRSILRQDPDIIMVGEIRDLETAEIAVRAGLTGHLVLSTLHTNNAAGAFSRLADMGVETFLINSSLLGVLAQRLVRRLCVKCRAEGPPRPGDLAFFERFGEPRPERLFRAVGCDACRRSGYRGRMGVYELFVPNEESKEILQKGGGEAGLLEHATRRGMRFMIQDALRKASMGLTTTEELKRVLLVEDRTG